MARWAAGLGLVGWCVLCSAGCRKPEPAVTAASARPASSEAPPEAPPPRPTAFVELPAPEPPESRPAPDEEQPPSRLLETDSESRERPMRRAGRPSRAEDEERLWLSEAAEAARLGNTRISPNAPVEDIPIATGTVDGRVRRVRPGTLEVSDDEGNVYELRIDGRSRGLRRGRPIPLKDLSEGTPVRASFDLVGGGESLARDIVLRR